MSITFQEMRSHTRGDNGRTSESNSSPRAAGQREVIVRPKTSEVTETQSGVTSVETRAPSITTETKEGGTSTRTETSPATQATTEVSGHIGIHFKFTIEIKDRQPVAP